MKHMNINPITIVQEHMSELRNQYRTTDDPQKKDFLARKVRNLQNVLEFLAGTQNDVNNVENFA